MYNGFKAKIIRVNTHNVVLSILEGPAKGEKRKTLFATVDVVEDAPAKKAKIPQAPAEESVAPTAAAPAAEAPAEDEQPEVRRLGPALSGSAVLWRTDPGLSCRLAGKSKSISGHSWLLVVVSVPIICR